MVNLATHVWVQEDGQVWSDVSGEMVCLTQQKDGEYKVVQISLDGKRRQFRVGRLVMFAWHHKRLMERCAAGDTDYLHPDDFEAGHKDDDPNNNAASNIEPQTRAEQLAQSHARSERGSNAGALSQPVWIAKKREGARCPFPAGSEYTSISEAARQTGISHGSIARSIKNGTFAGGVRFEADVRDGDLDPVGRVWYPSIESGKWYMTFGGLGFRVSSDGWFWHKKGDIKTRGHVMPGTIYRRIGIGGNKHRAHIVILRVSNGAFDENGEWVAQEVPKDANGKGLMCLHSGAPDDERRADGTERNHVADLRWGTRVENAADLAHSRASLRVPIAG